MDEDNFMELASVMVAMKSLFDSMVAAGFTENQSLKFLTYITLANAEDGEDTA